MNRILSKFEDFRNLPVRTKVILAGCAVFVLLFLIFWENLFGFYINMFNPMRPRIGNFWETYRKYDNLDSAKSELYEIEKLRTLAIEQGINYIAHTNKLLEELGTLILNRESFLEFYKSLPDNQMSERFSPYEFIRLYLDKKWKLAVLNLRDDSISIHFTNRKNQALPMEILLGYPITIDTSDFVVSNEDEILRWSYADDLTVNSDYRKVNLSRLIGYCQKNEVRIVEDEVFLIDWADRIVNTYLLKVEAGYRLFIEVDNQNIGNFWVFDINAKFDAEIDSFLRYEEVGVSGE